MGAAELDFRFSVLQSHTGYRHFARGISSLKQVTGREHWDIQRYIIAVIAGAFPKDFLIAVRSLMDFRYVAQAREIDTEACDKIQMALDTFHKYKKSIINAGGRRGEKGNIITNWYIPKLEFMQSVIRGILANGAAIQWSADVTEHAHITEVKGPADATNNQDYESQICRYLDREDKCRRFNLATAIREAGIDFRCTAMHDAMHEDEDDNLDREDRTSSLLERIDPVSRLEGTARKIINYFDKASHLQQGLGPDDAPTPFRTFAESRVAFHLNRDSSFKRSTVDEVTAKFKIPDLRSALAEYIVRVQSSVDIFTLGGRRANTGTLDHGLPFSHLEVWVNFRLQSKGYHVPHESLPAQTINASPPSDSWPLGHFVPVIFNTDPQHKWPHSGITGNVPLSLSIGFRE